MKMKAKETKNLQKNVLEYLENSVNLYPDKLAFADSENQYTYIEFLFQ